MGDEIFWFLLSGALTYIAWFRGKDVQKLMSRMYTKSIWGKEIEAYMKSDIYLWLMRILGTTFFMVLGVAIVVKLYGPK